MLPADIARCRGWLTSDAKTTADQCVNCARRLEGIYDYLHGNAVAWLEQPPEAEPCPEKLEPKK